MIRTSARALAALAATALLVVAMGVPRLGAALPAGRAAACPQHVLTQTSDPLACPICGGSWDDFVELMRRAAGVLIVLVGLYFGYRAL